MNFGRISRKRELREQASQNRIAQHLPNWIVCPIGDGRTFVSGHNKREIRYDKGGRHGRGFWKNFQKVCLGVRESRFAWTMFGSAMRLHNEKQTLDFYKLESNLGRNELR